MDRSAAGDRPVLDDGAVVADREVPSAEVLAEMRGRGPVSAAIADLIEDPKVNESALKVERARVKAEALAATTDGFTVTVGRKTFDVTDVRYDPERGWLSCVVPGVDDFVFVNPPVMVPDGTFTEGVDPDGEPVKVPNMVEDPAAALRVIVADAVAHKLR